MNIFLDSSSTSGGWVNVGGKGSSTDFRIFAPPRRIVETGKQARRRICRENLSKMWPPSETTRRHRKEVRVTDLVRSIILFRDDVVVYVGSLSTPCKDVAILEG